MNAFRLALCALAVAGITQARPIIVEESAAITAPDASWEFLGRFGVAIDGDWALISGERFVPDENAEGGIRHDGAAFLYQRSGSSWNFVGQLGPTNAINEWEKPGLGMKDGVAMTILGGPRIFERAGTTWTQAQFADDPPPELQGADIEINGGRILESRITCTFSSVVLSKSGGAWTVEGELLGHNNDCGDNPPANRQDLQGERAIIFNGLGFGPDSPVVRLYRPDESGTGWRQLAVFENQNFDTIFGPDVAMARPFIAITGSRERGTGILYEVNQSWSWSLHGMQAADSYLQPEPESTTSLKRFGNLLAQRNYSFNRGVYVFNIFRVGDELPHSSTHVVTLQARQNGSLGDRIDTSGNRIIVSGRVGTDGADTVRVFEVPQAHEHTDVQVHDFEAASSGAAWQPIAGSAFTVVTSGSNHVYRQSSTAGDAGSVLPTSTAANHSIQSEVTVRSFNGADRWVGLMTRRSDASNYYYVTLRSSGTVQLRRLVNGAITSLASAPASVVVGTRYRLRLESLGTAHRVYLNDRLVLTAHDSRHTQGTAGLVMYRASADYDNVIVTPSPFTTIYTQNFATEQPGNWENLGIWTSTNTGGVYRQSSTTGDARAVIGTATDDQVVQVRVRPGSLSGGTRWVGVLGRYLNSTNYLYVTLRNNNMISLRRLVNGQIQVLAEAPFTVTAGTWYTVRIEIVDELTRVFVNNQLRLSSNADPGPAVSNPEDKKGKVGLVMYRAAADYDDFLAYQP
jgi:hypothetical protein